MGALHEGHLSLVKKSLESCNHTVVSIFVNSEQFSPNEDFNSYPRDLDADQAALETLGVDVLFLPNEKIVYPDNFSTYVEENNLSTGLESSSRPHFFRGVLTVVLKLFNIVGPQSVFFGKKDYQQFRLVDVRPLVANDAQLGLDADRIRVWGSIHPSFFPFVDRRRTWFLSSSTRTCFLLLRGVHVLLALATLLLLPN